MAPSSRPDLTVPSALRAAFRRALTYPRTLALAAGAATVLAFAPFDLFPLPLFTLALLLFLWGAAAPGAAFKIGWWFGVGFLGCGVSWLHISINQFGNVDTPLALFFTLLFILAMALYYGLAGWLGRHALGRRPELAWLVWPSVWILTEWLRGWFLSGFPWLALGYSQTDSPLAGFVPLLGVYGVSGLLILGAALLLGAIQGGGGRRWIGLAALTGIWLAGWLLTQVTWTQPLGEPFKVSLAQANIPQSLKWDKSMRQMSIDRYLRLTRAHWDSRLVIWPETAVPAFMHQVWDSVLEPLGEEARGQGSEVLLGIAALDQDTRQYYNAALVPGTDELYFKRHLVPFGEFMPLKPLLGPLLAFMEIPMSDFSAGTSEVPPLVRVANHWAGLSICYEDVFGDEVLAALPDAAFLVNLSNDGWFGDSLAPRQHLQIARLRALETGRPLLRATNTGISALIGPQGQVEAQSRPFEEAVVSGLVQPMGGMTPYARLGNGLPVGLSLLLVGMGLIWSRRPT